MSNATCSIDACNGTPSARSWCSKHYQRWKRHSDPLVLIEIQGDDWTRFWSKIQPDDGPLRCWYWTDALDQDGYGKFRQGPRTRGAHRVAWEFLRGDIPDGLHLDHECRVRACVNPWHLDPVTTQVNSRRGAWWLDEDMCKRGHRYTARTERYTSSGVRYCLTCLYNGRAGRQVET